MKRKNEGKTRPVVMFGVWWWWWWWWLFFVELVGERAETGQVFGPRYYEVEERESPHTGTGTTATKVPWYPRPRRTRLAYFYQLMRCKCWWWA